MTDFHYSDSIFIARPSTEVYDLVSDITRTGEWSPICTACWWDEGAGAQVGAWFTGHNETPDRTWETRSQVVAAERGVEFAWLVGGAWVRWGYRFEAAEGGTTLTETWDFLPAGVERFHARYADDALTQMAERRQAAHDGIPVTLAAIKRVAEGQSN